MTPLRLTPHLLATAAEQLVGVPFRLHGRDPGTGLDCIGLFAAAMALAGRPVEVPTGYTLRLRNLAQWLPDPASCGFAITGAPPEQGDVVLLRPSAGQVHLAIAASADGWIHAHAGLRRVVRDAALPDGAIITSWRLLLANSKDT